MPSLPAVTCSLCCVENHTTKVLMVMAIAVHNRRRAILRSNTFLFRRRGTWHCRQHQDAYSFFLTSLLCSFIQWTMSNLIPASLIYHTWYVFFHSVLLQFLWFSGSPMNQSLQLFRRIAYTCASKSQSLSVS